MGDRKFLIIISLFAIIGLGMALALLSMMIHDEQDTFAGASSMKRGGGPPLQSLELNRR